MGNPLCKICGDDCSPKLTLEGYCCYCTIAYKKGYRDAVHAKDEEENNEV